MSWSEVSKINNNFKKSLNEQLRDNRFMGYYLFPLSGWGTETTWTAPEDGWYKVFCVGAGGDNYTIDIYQSRYIGSGAVSVKTYYISKGETFAIGHKVFSGWTYPCAYFDDSQRAEDAGEYEGGSGSAVKIAHAYGGDYNYDGQVGIYTNGVGVDVGVSVTELSSAVEKQAIYSALTYQGNTPNTETVSETIKSGVGILGYGGSVAYKLMNYSPQRSAIVKGKGACVLIIPLEFE